MRKRIICTCRNFLALVFILCIVPPGLVGQGEDYRALFEKGEYNAAFKIIDARLKDIYSARVDDKRVPTGFITMRESDSDIDLMELFRNRKAEGFFIEDNEEISTLHVYAARCQHKLKNRSHALRHYLQALRFRKITPGRDDVVFYEMSRIYRERNEFKGYLDALETACTLNREKYGYSKELGAALYTTVHKKKSIYHMRRYVESTEETVEPEFYLMIGNLYEDIGKYLETEKYYILYLEKKPENGYIHFALGHNAFKRTGNYSLARTSLSRALELLPQNDILRRSRAHEYRADMDYHDLEYDSAIKHYRETITYQEQIVQKINAVQKEIDQYSEKINRLKTALLKERDFDQFEMYEFLKDERAKKELDLINVRREYKKMNAGRVRWNLARSYENRELYNEAISFYRESIAFDYRGNDAREAIIKLQLKIKRGY